MVKEDYKFTTTGYTIGERHLFSTLCELTRRLRTASDSNRLAAVAMRTAYYAMEGQKELPKHTILAYKVNQLI